MLGIPSTRLIRSLRRETCAVTTPSARRGVAIPLPLLVVAALLGAALYLTWSDSSTAIVEDAGDRAPLVDLTVIESMKRQLDEGLTSPWPAKQDPWQTQSVATVEPPRLLNERPAREPAGVITSSTDRLTADRLPPSPPRDSAIRRVSFEAAAPQNEGSISGDTDKTTSDRPAVHDEPESTNAVWLAGGIEASTPADEAESRPHRVPGAYTISIEPAKPIPGRVPTRNRRSRLPSAFTTH